MRFHAAFDGIGSPGVAVWAGAVRLAEALFPLREDRPDTMKRQWINARMGLLAAAVERVATVPALVALARLSLRKDLGILRIVPRALRGLAGLAALDLGMYAWHRWSHNSPLFWRYHRVHHTDLALDVTTAIRLHPVELLFSIAVRGGQVLILGPSVGALLTYELLMQAAALFHHANVDLGRTGDARLARVFMTPRLHTRHHAATRAERDCNWGIVLSLWDRLFRTLDGRPALDRRLGVEDVRCTMPVSSLLEMPRASGSEPGQPSS